MKAIVNTAMENTIFEFELYFLRQFEVKNRITY